MFTIKVSPTLTCRTVNILKRKLNSLDPVFQQHYFTPHKLKIKLLKTHSLVAVVGPQPHKSHQTLHIDSSLQRSRLRVVIFFSQYTGQVTLRITYFRYKI